MSAPQRNNRAHPLVTKIESSPQEDRDVYRSQHSAEEWRANSHLRGDCSAKISREQYRAENGCARNHVKDNGDKLNGAERDRNAQRKSKLRESLDYRRWFHCV